MEMPREGDRSVMTVISMGTCCKSGVHPGQT